MKFIGKSIGVDTKLFPEVSSNMVTPNLSKLAKLRPKVDLGPTKETPKEDRHGKATAITILDLRKAHEDRQQKESVEKTDHSTKTIDKLLDDIRESLIELIKRGICPKYKVVV